MTKLNLYILLMLLSGLLLAQNRSVMKEIADEKSFSDKSYPADAREYLERYYQFNGIDPAKFQIPANQLKKTAAWGFNAGDKKSFYVPDLTPGSTYLTSFTCKAVGVNCYVFVEDTSWTKYVDQKAVDSLRTYFDSKTPANSNKGIYQTDVDTFGDAPDVDNDPRIIILVLNIRDGWTPGNGYVAGFFSPGNETGNVGIGSNHNQPAEIYHVDCYPTNLKTSSGLATGLSTTAHEFQHMIHWKSHQSNEQSFFDEGCSMVAEWINGFRVDDYLSFYSQTPNRYLLYWHGGDANDVLNDYGRATSFFLYLKEQFYDSNNLFFKKFVQSAYLGINAFDVDVLPSIGSQRRFADILIDWWIANYLNDRTIDPKWGFKYSNVPRVTSTSITNPNVSSGSGGVNKQAATFLSYISGKNLSINFNTNGKTGIKLKAIKIGAASKQVVDVTPSTNFTVPDFGSTYSNVTFLVCHNDNNDFTNPSNPTLFPFTYTSSGNATKTIQLISNDNNSEPSAVWAGNIGDTVAVAFTGIQGAKLDSIKVALRQAGSMNGGIWKYNSSWSPSPFGQKLAVPITVTSTISTRPPSPYPVPWPNWVKVDLTSKNIDASSDFAVGIFIQGTYSSDGSGANGLMFGLLDGTTFSNSMTYDTKPSSGAARWLWYVNNSNQTYVYLIRAYVSYGTTGVKDIVELLPSHFKLEQNYPNPFNPSTTIKYSIPISSVVTLKVFDLLGREVATLVDEFKTAGTYNSQFSILHSQFSSGVYFYTIKADNYFETKKMVLLK